MPAHQHIFQKYLSNRLIETGTFHGEGVLCALQSGFKEVHSIEIFDEYFQENKIRFKDYFNVFLYHGSTEEMLPKVLQMINNKSTFWLDAHWSGDGTPMSTQKCPLLDELDIIKQHAIKDHIIMIDDIRCCNTNYFESKDTLISKTMLEHKIREINPNYKIIYEDSWEPKDILVAFV